MIGVILLNLGTPESPSTEDVSQYLEEFLMDPFVIDLPKLVRYVLVKGIIMRIRPQKSAEKYQKIWTDKGSPLMVHSEELLKNMKSLLPADRFMVTLAMRYGTPTLESALENLKRARVTQILLLPLYPQFATATTASSIDQFKKLHQRLSPSTPYKILPPFFNEAAFLEAFEERIRETMAQGAWDFVLFSYHGLPARQLGKTDAGCRSHCLKSENCCDALTTVNKNCYRAQCVATTRALAQRLGLKPPQYANSFQSRVGKARWIEPYTENMLRQLAAQGHKRIVIAAPAFVSDCLETLEELAMEGAALFKAAGGTELRLVPSLNASASWSKGLSELTASLLA